MQRTESSDDPSRNLSRRELVRRATAIAGVSILPVLSTADRTFAAQDDAEGIDVRMLIRKPNTFNPFFSTSGNEQQIERLMFGALVKADDKVQPVPDLAESVDASPDAMTYTFVLREGLRFNDGEPLTSRDVEFTIERAVDSRIGGVWRGRLLQIEGAEAYGNQEADTISGIDRPDDRTISLRLVEPDAAFLISLADYSGLSILPEHALKDLSPDEWMNLNFFDPGVSGGEYEMVSYETDQYIELRRNEQYGGERPVLDRILLPIRTPAVALAEIERGELDIMTLPSDEAEGAAEIPGVSVVSVQSPMMTHIVVNNTRSFLQDKRVRQAMMYAIDRQGIVDAILRGEGEVVNSPIFGPESWMGIPEGLNEYAYSTDQARQLLSDASWDESQEVVMLVSNLDATPWAPIIQNQLQEVGIKVELLQVEGTELISRITSETPEFDLFMNGGDTYRADPNIASLFYTTVNLAPQGSNYSRYSNEKIDELFNQGRATTDTEQRKATYTEVAQILNEEVPNVFLWSPNSLFAVNDRVQGFKAPGYTDNKLWNAGEWSVDS